VVLCVNYGKKLLSDSKKIIRLKEICSEIEERYWFLFEAIGTDGDHVHIFVGSEPKFAPSMVMQIIKSITAKRFFKEFPEIKKELWGSEFWSDGGYIGTVGEGITAEIIRDYIEKQGMPEEKEGYKQMKLLDFD
jgi:putative transposase